MLGKRLRELRTNSGDSQMDLAEKLFVAPTTICSWEQGRSIPDCQKLTAICRCYQVSADELLGLNHPQHSFPQQYMLTQDELLELERYAQYMLYRRAQS